MDVEKDVIIYQLKSRMAELETANEEYKKRSEITRKNEFRTAGIIFLIIGACLVLAAYLMSGYSDLVNVLLMAGVGSLFLGAIVVSVNTERFMSQKVAQHLNLSSVVVLDALLRDLRLIYKGIYVPSSKTSGATKIFVPLEKTYELPPDAILKEDRAFLIGLPKASQEGVMLEPLGYHLFAYAKEELRVNWAGQENTTGTLDLEAPEESTAAMSLDRILQDTLVEGLELADKVTVSQNADTLHVTLHDTPYIAICGSIMREAGQVCRQIGCPLCSVVACIYTEFIDKEIIIESVESKDDDISLVCTVV